MEDERDSRTESLLDLPLRGEDEPTAERPVEGSPEPASSRSPLFDPPVEGAPEPPSPSRSPLLDSPGEVEISRPRPVPAAAPDTDSQAAPLLSRLKGGLIDVGMHLAVIGLLAVGARLLGARLTGATGSVVVMVLAFSFLYTILALLVWGRTPGAAVAGLEVRNPDGGTPTASQAVRRWLAQWVTWLLAGLPGLFRLADRWSGTQTAVR